MKLRFVVFGGEQTPKIYKLPVHQTARLRNEFSDWKPEIFESLNDAKQAALSIVERTMQQEKSNVRDFLDQPDRDSEELRAALSGLTEDRVEQLRM